MWWLFIPLLIVGVILVLMLALLLLGRYKNGALLRPLITPPLSDRVHAPLLHAGQHWLRWSARTRSSPAR